MLFGLAAASVPLLIHLLSIRKLRTIEFSSLRFLKELQRSSLRRVKIKQWLLLALRTLMIIALVFAFARPALRGSFAGFVGGRAATAMVVLLDDSPSTATRNERGEIFAQIKEAAVRVGGVLRNGDELYLSRTSDAGGRTGFVPIRTEDDLSKLLSPVEPSQVRPDFRDAVVRAARILSGTTAANRELYLLTDAQANQFEENPAKDSSTALQGLHVFVVHPSPAQGINGGVTSAGITTGVVSRMRPVDLQATVRTPDGGGPLTGIASVYFGGARVAQHSIDIPPGGMTTFHSRFVPRKSGIESGYVQLQDDALDIDNRRFFTLTVPGEVRVLLAGNAPLDTRFVRLGLTLGGDSTLAGVFSVESIGESGLSSVDLNSYDVVCLCDISAFTATTSESIARFVRSGGGLLMFMSENADLGNYNATLLPKLGIPPSQPAAGAPPANAKTDHGFTFRHIDMDHPLFEGMFEANPGKPKTMIESPVINRVVPVNAGETGRSVISLSDGEPFLVEFASGQGRTLLCAVDAAGGMSNFPTSALFAPLLYRSMIYLADATRNFPPVTVGQPIDVHLRLGTNDGHSAFAFISPSGMTEKVVPEYRSTAGAATFQSHPTSETGIYTLNRLATFSPQPGESAPGAPLGAIAVNVDTAESDLRQADPSAIEKFFRSFGVAATDVKDLPADRQLSTEIEQSRYGVELWRLFVGAALLFGLLEVGIGNALRRQDTSGPSQRT